MFSIAEIRHTHLYPASTVFSSVKQGIGVKCYLQFSSLKFFFGSGWENLCYLLDNMVFNSL